MSMGDLFQDYYESDDTMADLHGNMLGFDWWGEDFDSIKTFEDVLHHDNFSEFDRSLLPDYVINMRTKNGYTLLMFAVYYGAYNFAKYLLEHGADVNIKSNDGYTILHYLVSSSMTVRREKLLSLLIEYNANIEEKTPEGLTPFLLAAGSDGEDYIEVLHKAGADINVKTQNDESALLYAFINDSPNVVAYLVKNNLYSPLSKNELERALYYAVQYNQRDLVKFVLKQETVSRVFLTLNLMIAVCNKNLGIVKELVYAGAGISQQLIAVAEKKDDKLIYQFLLSKGVSCNDILGSDFETEEKECIAKNDFLPKTLSINDDKKTVEKTCVENTDFNSTLQKFIDKFLLENPEKKNSDIYKYTNISRQLFYTITKKKNYKTKRENIIIVASKMELSVNELKELLLSAGFALSEGNEFDRKILDSFKNKKYSEIEKLIYEKEKL